MDFVGFLDSSAAELEAARAFTRGAREGEGGAELLIEVEREPRRRRAEATLEEEEVEEEEKAPTATLGEGSDARIATRRAAAAAVF